MPDNLSYLALLKSINTVSNKVQDLMLRPGITTSIATSSHCFCYTFDNITCPDRSFTRLPMLRRTRIMPRSTTAGITTNSLSAAVTLRAFNQPSDKTNNIHNADTIVVVSGAFRYIAIVVKVYPAVESTSPPSNVELWNRSGCAATTFSQVSSCSIFDISFQNRLA
jgi:hypothetical protein